MIKLNKTKLFSFSFLILTSALLVPFKSSYSSDNPPNEDPERLEQEQLNTNEDGQSSDVLPDGCNIETWEGCKNSIEISGEEESSQGNDVENGPVWTDAGKMAALVRLPPAPQCPESGKEAVARFQTGLDVDDINLALTFYDWGGMNNATSEARIEQFMEMSGGRWVDGGSKWRWVDETDGGVIEFDTVKRGPCVFLRWENEGKPAFMLQDEPEPKEEEQM